MEPTPQVLPKKIGPLFGIRLIFPVIRDPIGALQLVYDRYGPLAESGFQIPLAKDRQRFILAVGPRYNERVLSDPETFGAGGLMVPGPSNSAHRRIRRGIVSMNGKQHEHYRRLLLPPVRRAKIDGMVERIGELVSGAIRDWPRDQAVDLWPLVKGVTKRVALATLFGAEDGIAFAEAKVGADLVDDHVRLAASPGVRGCPINLPGLPYRRMLRHAERVESGLGSWSRTQRGALQPDNLLSLIANSPNENGELLSDSQIAGHLLSVFGATYETCQSGLVWTLFLLAQHPHACAALLDELSPLDMAELSASRLEQCSWLDAVIKESMRLLPSVPFQARKALRNTDLVDCKVTRSTRVVLSSFLTNRLPGLYPDGDRFTPERWSNIHPSQYEYLVFSAGPRKCIGYWFAMTFLKVAVAHIVRACRITLVPGARVDRKVAIAMWPSRGVPVTIHEQDRCFRVSPIVGNICQLVRM